MKEFTNHTYEISAAEFKLEGVKGVIQSITGDFKSHDANDPDFNTMVYIVTTKEQTAGAIDKKERKEIYLYTPPARTPQGQLPRPHSQRFR